MQQHQAIAAEENAHGFHFADTEYVPEQFTAEDEYLQYYITGEKHPPINLEGISEAEAAYDAGDRKEFLKKIGVLSFSDAMTVLRYVNTSAYVEMQKRVSVYYDGSLGKYNGKDVPPFSPDSIQEGLRRDLLWSAMKGTPERTAYEYAQRIAKKSDGKYIESELPKLRGQGSRVGDHANIGVYEDVLDVYAKIERKIRAKAGENFDDESIQKQAVKKFAYILAESSRYNDPKRSPSSSRRASVREMLAWAQLGGQVRE